jgi:hypothetical protein
MREERAAQQDDVKKDTGIAFLQLGLLHTHGATAFWCVCDISDCQFNVSKFLMEPDNWVDNRDLFI